MNEGQADEKLKEFIEWLNKIEHEDFGVPKATKTIFLNVPVEYTIKLRENRLNKITGGEKQDIHESDTTHLKNASKSALMAAGMLGWNVIECIKDDKMRSIEDIAEEIWTTINN